MERTDPETVRQYLRELGSHLHRPVRLAIGGSIALILPELLVRSTTAIDVIEEVPEAVRTQYGVLDELARAYKLHLTHFQSHFLPVGWQGRLHTLAPFGQLQVSLVDAHDVFLSKLFSRRRKDLDDLRALYPQLDQPTIRRRLAADCGPLLGEEPLRRAAEHNWYVLTGQPLPGEALA